MRLVQLRDPAGSPRVAIVGDSKLRLLKSAASVYDLARHALRERKPLHDTVQADQSDDSLDYDPIYELESDWRLLPPFTHPEPARCLVSGTGLTHKKSAENRQAMHHNPAEVSDSMKMY